MAFTKAHEHRSVLMLTLVVLLLGLLSVPAAAQDCSATKLCASGCCSKFGFCGTDKDHCGDGCQSTCDYVPPPTQCSASQPCADGS